MNFRQEYRKSYTLRQLFWFGVGSIGTVLLICIVMTAWMEWKDTKGFDGDKSQCFECWCKKKESRT